MSWQSTLETELIVTSMIYFILRDVQLGPSLADHIKLYRLWPRLFLASMLILSVEVVTLLFQSSFVETVVNLGGLLDQFGKVVGSVYSSKFVLHDILESFVISCFQGRIVLFNSRYVLLKLGSIARDCLSLTQRLQETFGGLILVQVAEYFLDSFLKSLYRSKQLRGGFVCVPRGSSMIILSLYEVL